MSKELELVQYFSENATVITNENADEILEAYEGVNKFEDVLISHPHMHTTKKVLGRISTACTNATDTEKKLKFLLDYSSFLRFLVDFYKKGINKKEDGSLQVDKDWFTKPNLQTSFKSNELLNRYCSNEEQDELCCEPILLFDDESCVNEVNSISGFPIVIVRNAIDTQIMNEQLEGTYNLTPLLPVLNGIFNTVKQIGTQELLQSVIALRAKVIQLNGKPLTVKDKMLGRLSPPEGFIILRLAERLTNLKVQGTRILTAVQQAEAEDAEITPEEFEEIKGYLINILKQPLKRTTNQVMGPLMSREVIRLENQAYNLSPEALANDFLQAIEDHAAKLPNDPNKYYTATKQMFAALQPASSTKTAADHAASIQYAAAGHETTPAGTTTKSKTFLNLQHPRSKEAARAAIGKVTSLIDRGAKPEDIAAALSDLHKRFIPHE